MFFIKQPENTSNGIHSFWNLWVALKRAVLMVEPVYEVTVDAQSVHHPHARKLSVESATASQLDPRWPDRTCRTTQRGVLSVEQSLVSWTGIHVPAAHSRLD
jgi:hypothetical protein